MQHPSDAAEPGYYELVKPEGLLAHYTDASAAFEHIVPRGKLRLSPYRVMRDPAENKDIKPNICSSRPAPDDQRAIDDVWALIKTERARIRVLCLARDAEVRGPYPGYDCCWSRPRMWEQYADEHRGACLLFDRSCLERAIREQLPDDRNHTDNVQYKREASEEAYKRGLNADQILEDEQPARAVRRYIVENRDAFFFSQERRFRHGVRVSRRTEQRSRGRWHPRLQHGRPGLRLHRLRRLIGRRGARPAIPQVATTGGQGGVPGRGPAWQD